MSEYKKYLKEYYSHSSLSEQELMEMANLDSNVTGVDNVIIWVGPNPNQHWRRIKVSNIPNKISDKDVFTITIPDFKIIGKVNTKLINKDSLEKIHKWILKNIDAINDYSDYKITTNEFISRLTR